MTVMFRNYIRARFMKSSWLIKNATVLDRNSVFNGQSLDIHIHQGIITNIGNDLEVSAKVKVIDEPELFVTPGWMDLRTTAPDPGNEIVESISSVQESARLGGYSALLYMPTGDSADNASVLRYIQTKTLQAGVKLYTAATYSEGRKGKQVSEMFDMQKEGAIAFSDFDHLASNEMLSRVMEYGRDFNARIFLMPLESFAGGQIHEGKMAVSTGLKGMPVWQETIAIQRIITLAKYYNTSVHIELISCSESVDAIRAAKKAGIQITCGVSPLHLMFTDENLTSFDTNLKLSPPLRCQEDLRALLKGLRDGTIDVIVSDHRPVDVEHKHCEFDLAEFGAITLQHAFLTALNACASALNTQDLIEKFSFRPYQILGLQPPVIAKNSTAQFSCFSTSGETSVTLKNLASRSRNSPLLGKTLKGRVFPLID